MRRVVFFATAFGLALTPVHVSAMTGRGPTDECLAVNPGQAQCSFTVTQDAATPVSGAAGRGSWIVTIKSGKVKTTLKSPSGGDPTALSYALKAGDKVTAKALTPGSAVVAGDL
ncbi:MAG: hypothetical protein QOC87_1249 [Actinomycetota bacterium]|nr:hypothetical protein [Actinomycetota bacterium]